MSEGERLAGHHSHSSHGSTDETWLAATLPFFLAHLPAPPARVVEIGCGRLGGQVSALRRAGYDAVGVDPEAPKGAAYRRLTFETFRPDGPVDTVIASVSLHHVDSLAQVLDQAADSLRPGGAIVVVEWISEDLDEATAEWCFAHGPRDPEQGGAWLANLRLEWMESGLSWQPFFHESLERRRLHPAGAIRHELERRFSTVHESVGPYYFPDLTAADEAAEAEAIARGEIRAGCLRYAGRLRKAEVG